MRDEIDPEIVAARKLQAPLLAGVDVTRLDAAEARALANKAAMVFNDGKPEMQRIEDFEVPCPYGSFRARVYQPAGARADASIFYVHGGGWLAYDVDTHDRTLRFLAQQSGLSLLAFDFRLSPEHAYPAALDDCRTTWAWLHRHGPSHGIPTDKVAIGGDSAGGNMGLALTIDQRDRGGPRPVGLALAYGCFAPELMTESRERFKARAFGLTPERMDWHWSAYLGDLAGDPPRLAAPLHADLAGLPPVYLGIAEFDVVADDSRLLAARLAEANVTVELDVWPRSTHGVLQMTRDVQIARDAGAVMARALARFAS
jgi:acetyl esterase